MTPDRNAPLGDLGNPFSFQYKPDYLYEPLYDWSQPVEFDLFWLVFPTFTTLTAAQSNQQVVNVPNDADFEVRRIIYHVDVAAAQATTLIVPNVTILIVDSGSGRALMNNAAPLASVACAESTTPIDLPWPKIFTRNSQVTVTLTNFDVAAATNNLRITLAGRKIFSKGMR